MQEAKQVQTQHRFVRVVHVSFELFNQPLVHQHSPTHALSLFHAHTHTNTLLSLPILSRTLFSLSPSSQVSLSLSPLSRFSFRLRLS